MDKLIKLVSPPKKPNYNKGDWSKVEDELGIWFPDSYVKLIETYGEGRFGEYLYILNPFSVNPAFNLEDQLNLITDQLEYQQGKNPNAVPFPLYPDDGCIIPWGKTESDVYLFWKCTDEEKPETWPILVHNGIDKFELRTDTVVNFIYSWLNGTLGIDLLPDQDIEPIFELFKRRDDDISVEED